jgi:predicted nucleotidyltransferase
MRDSLGHDLVRDHTVYACVMGSRAFGLATDTSDTDLRGVYVAPTPLFWGFEKPPTHVTGPRGEQFSWELERFCALALRANPNLLECLHSPLVEHVDAVGRELLDLREAFMSRLVEATFRGYAAQQLSRMEADIRSRGEPRWNHAMHLLRLLTSCRDLLRTGRLTVDVGEQRDRLLAVKRGERTWDEVRTWMRTLHEETDAAGAGTPLPDEPDRARVEDFLIRVRRASASGATSAAPSAGSGTAAGSVTVPGAGTAAGSGAGSGPGAGAGSPVPEPARRA